MVVSLFVLGFALSFYMLINKVPHACEDALMSILCIMHVHA